MDDAFAPNRPDVLALRRDAERHARRVVTLGSISILLALPVAVEAFATPFVALAAVLVVVASSDVSQGRHRQGRKRLLMAAAALALAGFAWIPRSLEDGEISLLLFAGPIALVALSYASLSALWAGHAVRTSMALEAKRAHTRAQRAAQDHRGKGHGMPGVLTRAEIKATAAERGGKASIAATPWRGTPAHVSLADARHPTSSPAERALRKDLGDRAGSIAPAQPVEPMGA